MQPSVFDVLVLAESSGATAEQIAAVKVAVGLADGADAALAHEFSDLSERVSDLAYEYINGRKTAQEVKDSLTSMLGDNQ